MALTSTQAQIADRFDVRKRRTALGLSREKLAAAAGLSGAAIRYVEFGYLGTETLPKIERTLTHLEANHAGE